MRNLVYNCDLIPPHTRAEMKAKHVENREGWLFFASRCQKNEFVRKYLLSKHNALCAICGMPIKAGEKFQVHHCNYDHCCVELTVVKQPSPTAKRPQKIRKTTNCEYCFQEKREQFEKCVSFLVPVHGGCHQRISTE